MGRTKARPRRVGSLFEHNEWVENRERQGLSRLDAALQEANEANNDFLPRSAFSPCRGGAASGDVAVAPDAGRRRSGQWKGKVNHRDIEGMLNDYDYNMATGEDAEEGGDEDVEKRREEEEREEAD